MATVIDYPFVGYFLRDGSRYDVHYNDNQMIIVNGAGASLAFDIPFDAFKKIKPTTNHAKELLGKKSKK